MTRPPLIQRAGEEPRLVTHEYELFDPLIEPPPRGVSLLLINPGGVLIIGKWTDDCLAWGPKPGIPASVKKRQRQ